MTLSMLFEGLLKAAVEVLVAFLRPVPTNITSLTRNENSQVQRPSTGNKIYATMMKHSGPGRRNHFSSTNRTESEANPQAPIVGRLGQPTDRSLEIKDVILFVFLHGRYKGPREVS